MLQQHKQGMEFSDEADAELVLRARAGNLDAYDQIVLRYQNSIARSLYRFCPHQSDLEDLVQEAFIKAYRALEQWKPTGSFEHWLRRIAYNTGYDYYRKNRRNPLQHAEQGGGAQDFLLESIQGEDAVTDQVQASEEVHWVLQQLKPEDRWLLTLQYLESLSLQEIADQAGWSLAKTKVKSFRAKKKLRKLLDNHEIAQT